MPADLTPRERLIEEARRRGMWWSIGQRADGTWEVDVGNDDGDAGEAGATEEEACAAVLEALPPVKAKTLREEVTVLLDAIDPSADNKLRRRMETPGWREALLDRIPDLPAAEIARLQSDLAEARRALAEAKGGGEHPALTAMLDALAAHIAKGMSCMFSDRPLMDALFAWQDARCPRPSKGSPWVRTSERMPEPGRVVVTYWPGADAGSGLCDVTQEDDGTLGWWDRLTESALEPALWPVWWLDAPLPASGEEG